VAVILVILGVLIVLLRRRHSTRKRTDVTATIKPFTAPNSTVKPYDSKSKHPPFQSDIPGPFPEESNQNLAPSSNVNSRSNMPTGRFPWQGRPSDLEQPRPYNLKEDVEKPVKSSEWNSNGDSHLAAGRVRRRSSSESSPVTTSTETTSRQMRLQVEAEAMRAQLFAVQQQAITSAEEIRRMKAHIQTLEMQINLEWDTRGPTDNPPPTYTA
jgi:hypothetical protein